MLFFFSILKQIFFHPLLTHVYSIYVHFNLCCPLVNIVFEQILPNSKEQTSTNNVAPQLLFLKL